MSTKTLIVSEENLDFYHEYFLNDEIKDVIISVTNPSDYCIERISTGDISARISLSSKDMDKISIAWIKDRKIQHVFGGPVGKEYGSPDCSYD